MTLFDASFTSPVLVMVDGWPTSVAESVLYDWLAAHPVVAVDTETAGLGWNDAVRLVQFGTEADGFAIDVSGPDGKRIVAHALELCATILLYNAPFDVRALQRIGISPKTVWPRVLDVHILAHVSNPDRMSFKLKPLADAILGAGASDEQKLLQRSKASWATAPLSALVPYAIQDTRLTYGLYDVFREQVNWEVSRKEHDVRWLALQIMAKGMRLDVDYAQQLKARWSGELNEDRVWFATHAKIDALDETDSVTNPNANAQLIGALQSLGWKPKEFTPKSGQPKLDKAILESLAGTYELVDRLLEYKRKTKWLAAYVENCLGQVDDQGRVHAGYNTLGAKTGRMSCSNPPLQQLPKGGGGEIRRLFIAADHHVIGSVDYSAIEFRLAGAFSGDRRITDVYAAGGDWYQQVADDLGTTRPAAKLFVLSIMYGAGPRTIGAQLHIRMTEAKRLVANFWKAYPTLAAWVASMTTACEAGLPTVSGWGRPLRPHSPYAAANAKIQGTAAEVLKSGILRLATAGLLGYVVAIVHDEVVLELPEADAAGIVAEVAGVLEDRTFGCPLVAEGSIFGPSWGDGYL